jgi:alanyl-tRNA synthetase
MGGQIGDKGTIKGDGFEAIIFNTKKNVGGKVIHYVKVTKGTIEKGYKVTLEVDKNRRSYICKNHTATHMLQEALKEVVGEHIHQAGSFVDDERLRFDFNHFQALTIEEIEKVEDLVNKKIMEVESVDTKLMTLDEAKETGAMALFDDKYGDKVRVVSIGDFSMELCGGTHVKNAGEIGLFKILSETGVASGVRRIEAVTGFNAIKYVEDKQRILKDACSALKCSEKDIITKISLQGNELKEKDKEISELKSKLTSGAEDDIINSAKEIQGVNVISYALEEVDANSLRDLADKVRNKMGSGVVVLMSNAQGKVNLVGMATKDVLIKGIHCGNIIKEISTILGGGGGGRPDMAQAGGKKPEMIPDAVEKVYEIVKSLVK